MPDTSIAYTRDESWRIDLVAFQINAFVYRAIGATIRAYHWETSGILRWRSEKWAEQPVESLSLRLSYEGVRPGLEPMPLSLS